MLTSTVQPRCEECDRRFDPLRGGLCRACGRMLCGTHLYGLFRQLVGPLQQDEPACVACRNAGRAADQADST